VSAASSAASSSSPFEGLFPKQESEIHKGDRGRVLVVAGSVGLSGAARLCAGGALSGGAGLVTVATPRSVRAEVAAGESALMTRGLSETLRGGFSFGAAREALALVDETAADSVALGPGLGRDVETIAFARRLVLELPRPTVVDADALHALAASTAEVPPCDPKAAVAPRIYTPHAGEAARLLGIEVAAVRADREGSARRLVALLGGVVVLKGAGTITADGARLEIERAGNAGLAVGGSGDVLSGVVAALLAAGLAPFDAASLGVRAHAVAADRLRDADGKGPIPDARLRAEIFKLLRR
jgi:ADP-dependent NAD(P)H-hydrate dehydratase